MRVVIVGAGISGLSCYLFLQKHLSSAIPATTELDIIILESLAATRRHDRSATTVGEAAGPLVNTVGAAVGLAPNGLSVLRDLNEAIFAQIANSGYPVSHFHLASAHGHSLARIGATNQNDPELHAVLITRQRLWDCLRQHVPDNAIADRRAVSGVVYSKAQRPAVQFADGSTDLEADLVMGADGVKSLIKRSVTGDGRVDKYPAIYEWVMSSRVTLKAASDCTAPIGDEAAWWSTYETINLPDTRNFDREDILRQLKTRHAGWADPVVQKIVDGAVINSIYPTWITPELPTWHARGLVLVGDAAHAMQPSSGQGTSQGLEDAQVFSMLLAHYVERHFSQSASRVGRQVPASISEAVDQASKEYFELRRPRVKRIVDRAKQMGDTKRKKGLFEEYLTYLIL
ncbi:MAG: hypothetical protein Q9208_003439 [Pyrenodesmia sp. 3 TL-2023]